MRTIRAIGRSTLVALAALTFLFSAHLGAQVRVSGQASASWKRSGLGPSPYVFNDGRGSFGWRGDLFVDVPLSDGVILLSSFRMEQNRVLDVDLLDLRFVDVFDLPVSVDVGEIDVPFGNLGERRYPKANPFFALPLGREHVTSLRSSDYALYRADARFQVAGNGFRILDGGLYDIGAKISATAGPFDLAVAVTNGAVSASSTYGSTGLNASKGVGTAARIALTPVVGLTTGLSFARGPFLKDRITYSGYSVPSGSDPLSHPQEIVGADIDFSIEHFSLYGEGFLNRWDLRAEYGERLEATGYSVEARYAFLPRLSAAVRVGGLMFNKIAGLPSAAGTAPETWDRDITRYEFALGYRVSREALLKAVYVLNRSAGPLADPSDDTAGLQAVVSF